MTPLEVFNLGTVKRWPSEKKGETFNFTASEAAIIREALRSREEQPPEWVTKMYEGDR